MEAPDCDRDKRRPRKFSSRRQGGDREAYRSFEEKGVEGEVGDGYGVLAGIAMSSSPSVTPSPVTRLITCATLSSNSGLLHPLGSSP